jgi:hypothetical protein
MGAVMCERAGIALIAVARRDRCAGITERLLAERRSTTEKRSLMLAFKVSRTGEIQKRARNPMPRVQFGRGYRRASTNSECPYQVALPAAAELIDVMDRYCLARFGPPRTRRDMRGWIRYCFANPRFADELARQFGGERIDVATPVSPDALIWKP